MALVLFFVPNPDKGVAEMIRVCKSKGKIAAYVWDILGHGLPTSPIHRIFEAKGALEPRDQKLIDAPSNSLEKWSEAG